MTLPVGQLDNVNPKRAESANQHSNTEVVVTDAYADILKYKPAGNRSILTIAETGDTFGLTYSVYVSIANMGDPNTVKNSPDDGFPAPTDDSWMELVTDQTLLSGKNKIQPFYFGWSFVRVQVKNTVGGSAATCSVWAKGD